MVTIEEVRKVKEKNESELMKKSGVTGCGIGYKYVDGKKTDELCIVCYVKKKKSEAQLKKKDIIPKTIEGVQTDVVESGEIRSL
ncbi:MAG: hypothetical protein ACXACO_21105 [Promethearchaeota archaeon]|jgi:hypothetical protein